MYEFEMLPPEGTIRGARRGLPLLLTPTSCLRDLQKNFAKNVYTDKIENKIFPIYKEISMGAVAKSYMKKGFLVYMRKCANS
jgi:hypothetical protein